MNKRNIILVGFMGTGKTVTGGVLARRTGMKLVDMDTLIAEHRGKPSRRFLLRTANPPSVCWSANWSKSFQPVTA